MNKDGKKIKCVEWDFLNEIKLSVLVIGSLIVKTGKHKKGQVKYHFIAADCTVFNKRPTKCLWFVKQIVFPHTGNEGWEQ